MAGYPVFQPQAPNIDINLFGEAATAGAKLGTAIPSATTSIIRGVQEGIDFESKIEAQDARTRLVNAEAKNTELAAERNQAIQSAEIAADTAKLTLETDQAKSLDSDLVQQNQFFDQFSKANLEEKGQILTSGNPVFLKNPAMFKEALQQYSLELSPNDPKLGQINRLLGHATLDDYYQKKAQASQEDFEKSQAEAFNGKGRDLTAKIVNGLQVPEELAPTSVDILDRRLYQIDPETNHLKTTEDGKSFVKVDPATISPDLKGMLNPYIAVSNRPDSKGLVVADDISKEAASSYDNYLKNKSLVSGQQLQNAKRIFDTKLDEEAGRGRTQNTSIPTFNDDKGFGKSETFKPQKPEDFFRANIKNALHLTDEDVETVKGPLDKLYNLSRGYVQNVQNRNDPNYIKQIAETQKTIARQISDNQFRSTAAVQALYTKSHVEANNDLLDATARQIDPEDQYGVSALFDSHKVLSPEDLYYNNYGVLIYRRLSDHTLKSNTIAMDQQRNRAQHSSVYQDMNSNLQQKAAGNGG